MRPPTSGEVKSGQDEEETADRDSRPRLSVVVPAYNEVDNLRRLHERVRQTADDEFASWEVIYVDDGSTDGTYQLLSSLSEDYANVKIIKFWQNFGKANALAVGFKNARGEVVVTIDADLQDDPSEIPRLVSHLDEGYDLVSGWRHDRKSPLLKRLTSRMYNNLTAALTGVNLHDLNCGFKAYRRGVLEKVEVYGGLHRYIPVLAYWQGFRVGEVKVSHHPRKHGSSKYKTRRLANGFFDLLSVTFLTQHSRTPLRVFGGFGTLSTSVGVIIGFYLLYAKYVLGQGIGNRPLLFLSILLVIVGIQLFSLGFVAEKITARNRAEPHYELLE